MAADISLQGNFPELPSRKPLDWLEVLLVPSAECLEMAKNVACLVQR